METNFIEGNKLIVNFKENVTHNFEHYYLPQFAYQETFSSSELRYHLSWDWLMPVIEKIESLGISIKIVGYYHDGDRCAYNQTTINYTLPYTKNGDIVISGEVLFKYHSTPIVDKLKSTYEAVVEFIKWYNQNKK